MLALLREEMINMANITSAINVNVDSSLKREATNILNDLGLNMSTAINMFLKQIVKKDGIPFEVVNPKPNKELLAALKEAENIKNGNLRVKSYNNLEDLRKALDE